MLKLNLFSHAVSGLIKILEAVGRVLNKTPTKEENAKAPKAYLYQEPIWKTKQSKTKFKKEIYDYKGSGYNGKGGVNTDAAIFNHPRTSVLRNN